MAKRTSRSQANELAPGAPAEPRAPGSAQGGARRPAAARSRRPPSASKTSQPPGNPAVELQESQDEFVASEIENPLTASEPTEEEIRLCAYRRFLDRGATHGEDFSDWLEAERELKKL